MEFDTKGTDTNTENAVNTKSVIKHGNKRNSFILRHFDAVGWTTGNAGN